MVHANNIDTLVNCSVIVGALRIQPSSFSGCVSVSATLLIIAISDGLTFVKCTTQ